MNLPHLSVEILNSCVEFNTPLTRTNDSSLLSISATNPGGASCCRSSSSLSITISCRRYNPLSNFVPCFVSFNLQFSGCAFGGYTAGIRQSYFQLVQCRCMYTPIALSLDKKQESRGNRITVSKPFRSAVGPNKRLQNRPSRLQSDTEETPMRLLQSICVSRDSFSPAKPPGSTPNNDRKEKVTHVTAAIFEVGQHISQGALRTEAPSLRTCGASVKRFWAGPILLSQKRWERICVLTWHYLRWPTSVTAKANHSRQQKFVSWIEKIG